MSKINLSNYKSSGVYFIETDNSIIEDVIEANSLKLAVGFSENGPFNKPIVLSKPADRKKIFGDGINTKLERNGCFFERSLDILLESGEPVIALNLLNCDEADKVGSLSLSTGYDEDKLHMGADNNAMIAYQEFFDRSRFWTPSPENLLMVSTHKTLGKSGAEIKRNLHLAPIFNIVNVGTSDVTVFIVKDTDVTGYNMTFDKWYNGQELPYSWMKKNDFVSDYFIKVIAIKGDWTSVKDLAVDITWSKYFDKDGLKADMLNKFIVADGVNLVGAWSGSIIPNFYNKAGNLVSIEPIVNSYTTETGIMIALNEYAMEAEDEANGYSIDLVGHDIPVSGEVKILSYKSVDASNFMKASYTIMTDSSIKLVNGKELILANNEFLIEKSNGVELPDINDLIVVNDEDGNKKLSRIVKRQYIKGDGADNNVNEYYKFVCLDDIANLRGSEVEIHKSMVSVFDHIEPQKLNGLKISNKHRPGYDASGAVNMEAGVEKIYDMLINDEGIHRGLIDAEMISYRYIIDTMAGGLGAGLKGKNNLANLAKSRGKCTAFINLPSVTEMNMSTDPLFADANNIGTISNKFNTDYIPLGGNPDYICTDPLTLPTKDEGADYCGVFSPFLKYRDNSRTILIPPAAHVARVFATKYAAGADQYMTIANRNGILNDSKVVGLEYQYDQADRDNLEPYGINPIIKQNGNIMIYGDRTAYQEVASDLNYLHIRELLNTIEIECYNVLKNYVFKKNDEITRAEIVRKLTPILDEKINAGALYSYNIKMDAENNTEEIINRSFAVVDIEVQCTKNMEKILTQIKIEKYTA